MARFIDAEDLKAVIKANDWSNPVVPDVVGIIIDRTPTADVVPKSEVERLQEAYTEQNKALAKVLQSNADMYAYARAEVAREIFEEIEKKVNTLKINHLEELNKEHIKDTPLYDRHSGILFALQRMDDFIAELKKKYTKENTENENQN